jgi:DNA polymerase-4
MCSVREEASILHADLDSFYASVEQRDQSELKGRPVIVGGGGVVLAASYEAKAFGVRGAMSGYEARRLCPHAVWVAPRMKAYSEASEAVFAVFRDTTPLVEGLSIDEAFLDVGGLRRLVGPPVAIATTLRARVRDEVGLPITVGIARTKFLAKVASDVAKPDGLLEVPAGTELDFLHPLPVERLWGVGPKTSARLHNRGIATVGELAALPEAALVSMLGPAAGRHLHALAHHRDPRPVEPGRRRRSIGSQHAIGRRRHTREEVDAVLVGTVDRVARRLRSGHRLARTVVLRLRFDDFTRITRSHSLPVETAHTDELLAVARWLLAETQELVDQRGLTAVGISVTNLIPDDAVQLVLPFAKGTGSRLDAALDEVRDRFGTKSVTRAVLLHAEDRSVPVLPDP